MRLQLSVLGMVLCVVTAGIQAGALAQATAPLTDAAEIFWSHAPYEMGECSICHVGDDPAAPGALRAPVNELCFGCHDVFKEMLAGYANVHPPVEDSCVGCHNPHNSRFGKLLNASTADLCGECHGDILQAARGSAVRHDAVTSGPACLNCHDPHASNVEAMLTALPFDLCVDCHGQDGMTDESGRPLTNLKALLAGSRMQHGPVENKDCSACHLTHGGANFRMLVSGYPEKFYAPYDPQKYELCFSCHEIDVFSTPRTETLTGFRDGSRNLHYVHVNKVPRGRTCRACHEVHAAPHQHMVRDGVPYGPKNWMLKINFTWAEDGGSCAKTCHPAKPYSRKVAP